MRPLPLVAALVVVPALASAQVANLAERALRPPAVAIPNATVAGAEEPAGLQVNPAAPGFLAAPSLQYFHERRTSGDDRADALFLSVPLGPLVPTLALDWMRPEAGPRFRRVTLGGAAGGDALSLGYAFTWFTSPDASLERLTSWGAGITARPLRWLSLGASATERGARLRGEKLAARYALGAAVRLWEDRLTLSSELVASDRARDDFDPTGVAAGIAAEVWGGFALSGQVQAPLHGGREDEWVGQVAFTWNAPHSGVTVAMADDGRADGHPWLVGARFSGERYRAEPIQPDRAVRIDVARALERGGSLLLPGEPDPFGRLLRRLEDLRDDPAVSALVLELGGLDLGTGRSGELRTAIAGVAARKPVLAYLSGGRIREYWVATAATAVHAPPSATLDVTGVSSTTPFLRDTLAKAGVAFEVVAAGPYKNAPDPLVRGDMSDAQREVTNDLLDQLFGRIVRDVAERRRLAEPRVRELVDTGLFTVADATAAGLLDGAAWPDELEALTGKLLGRKTRVASRYEREPDRRAQRWGPRPVIAIVPVEGAIARGRSRSTPFGGDIAGDDTIATQIRRAAEARDVKAIVLRIDSPGGDALASDLMWRAVVEARRKGKPVIASMGDVAASGGYFVAAGADAIVAEPATITGSIGVFALKPDFSGLLAKLDARVVTLQRGEAATVRATSKPWSDAERRAVERQVQATYEVFLSRVAEGRHLTREQVEAVAGGRVWTGEQALARGLVDRMGSLEDAVALARERARLRPDEAFETRRYERRRGLLGWALGGGGSGEGLQAFARLVPELGTAALLLELGPVVAMPLDAADLGALPGRETRP